MLNSFFSKLGGFPGLQKNMKSNKNIWWDPIPTKYIYIIYTCTDNTPTGAAQNHDRHIHWHISAIALGLWQQTHQQLLQGWLQLWETLAAAPGLATAEKHTGPREGGAA